MESDQQVVEGFEARPVLAEWLRRLAEELESPYALDEDGRCILPYDGNVAIVIDTREGGPEFFLSAPVIPVPEDPDDRYGFMRLALQLNQLQARTRGGALALDEEGAILSLCYLQDINDFDREGLEGLMGAVRLTVGELREAFGFSTDLREFEEAPPDGGPTASSFGFIKV